MLFFLPPHLSHHSPWHPGKILLTLISLRTSAQTSLVVQWLRLHTPKAGGPGSIPGQGTKFHMPQLSISQATTKTLHSQMK